MILPRKYEVVLQTGALEDPDKIQVEVDKGGVSLHSNLATNRGLRKNSQHKAAIDGFEALVMGCASAGVDIDSPEFVYAMNGALEAIDNIFGD